MGGHKNSQTIYLLIAFCEYGPHSYACAILEDYGSLTDSAASQCHSP